MSKFGVGLCCVLLLAAASQSSGGLPEFREAGPEVLSFQHISPISPERHLHLFMGSGLGWIDFDRDGELDLLVCQGAVQANVATEGGSPAVRLLRRTGTHFHDNSVDAGLTGDAYSLGLTVADFDHDGFPDVFATGLLSAALLHNNGDGTWTDTTSTSGIVPEGFGTGCCWVDLDGDQNLDLACIRYVAVSETNYPLCTVPSRNRQVAVSCNPRRLRAAPDSVYWNRGDGRFEDVSRQIGMASVDPRPGLGCVSLDLDDDGRPEMYVANDGFANSLWKRAGPGQLREMGLLAGVALSRNGAAQAGMGIAAGDMDGDLRPDLLVTNYFNETNTLYRNEGYLSFLDVTEETGLRAPSRNRLGFGVTLADFDNDGWADLLIANGHVQDQLDQLGIRDEPFAQLSQVLVNRAGRKFEDTSRQAGAFFQSPAVCRGTAAADVNGDGRPDVAVLRLNGRVALLENHTTNPGHWLGLHLVGRTTNRDAIGAAVVVRAEGRAWRRDRMSSSSYLSCDSPVLHFGIGAARRVEKVTVRWSEQHVEEFDRPEINGVNMLFEGRGRQLPIGEPALQSTRP